MSIETRRAAASGKQPMSINTSQHYDPYYSPPRTPPQKSRYRTTRRPPPARPSLRETFFDDTTPVENERPRYSGDEERDPHDLSFEPKHATRLSVVDNMLLSLDQFGGDSMPADDVHQDPDPYTTYSRYASMKMGRPRGHTFSSSVSSDMDVHSEENSGRYSSQYPRTRRSNSSSNYHPGLQRINSVRTNNGGDHLSTRSKVYEAQRAVNPAERTVSRRASRFSGQESKSSGSSSVDFNQMLAGTRVGNYRERRSASFDYGAGAPPNIPTYQLQNSFDSRNHSRDHSAYDDIDAAPTPNVPTRSRRNISPPMQDYPSSQPAGSGTRTPALSRKNSARSARSTYNRKGRSDTLGTGTVKGRGDDFRQYQEDIPDVPPIQNFARQPAPSPTIAFHKTSYFANPSLQETTNTPPPKERTGFFRRVFGGSSKNSSPSQSVRELPAQNDDPRDRQRPSHSAPSTAKGTRQPASTYQSSTINTSSRENAQQVLTKKSSSFFRRRKKSFAEHVPPPLNLAQSNTQQIGHLKVENLKNGNSEPSPVSSLRRVMKPYLAEPASESEGQDYDPGDADNEISANEYASTKRKENYAGRHAGKSKPSTERVTKVKPGLNLNFAAYDRNDSFLADSSGNEGTSLQPSERHRRPLTSPTAGGHTQTFDGSSGTIRAKRPSAARNDTDTTTGSSVNKDGLSSSKSSLPKAMDQSKRPSSAAPASKVDSPAQGSPQVGRGWLEPASSTEQVDESKLVLPLEGTTDDSRRESMSTVSQYHTASNTPIINEDDSSRWGKPQAALVLPTPAKVDEENESEEHASKPYDQQPTPADREQAQKLFDKPGDDLANIEPTAAWLGSPERGLVRRAYMELFDWSNMNILSSLRSMCVRIAVKGETQQVDRVLDAFSLRWCECNPSHGFKATDVVHTICYSLLLLNTDLHLADIEQKMTRNQFIRNTMPTIQRVASDAAPDAFEPPTTKRISVMEGAKKSPTFPPRHRTQGSVDMDTSNSNLSTPVDSTARVDSINPSTSPAVDVGPLVTTPFRGTMKAWEVQVEAVLKDFYNSIQRQRLPLHGAPTETEDPPQQANNFLTLTGNMLRRTPSTLSKNSDVFPRGRPQDNRYATARWSSKPRSRPRLYPASNIGSSRTSLDDQSSVWSPAASSTWSKYSLGKTLTSMSVDSLGSEYPRGDYQQSIGFANALSHAIIREDHANSISGAEEPAPAASLLEDETLELAGAPWAKEGSLKHKQHLDAVDKRSKDRNWNESFAVIQRGWMRLFSFNSSSKSMRVKAKPGQNIVVGGGNWMENAEETWKFLLRQTIASALPPPGYSKSRPHVFALSLPTGAVHLFQVGTPEIVKEFVSTANYWSARLSKEPLSGGISNIEYGWSDAVINSALVNTDAPPGTGSSGPRPSIQSSIRSSIDQQTVRPRLPADRINISDWSPPQQTVVASTLTETEQLTTLRNYVKHVEEELQRHNELRGAMVLAFTPRHPNAHKALANWERKSSYLLREIVKFRTYIDCLNGARAQMEKIRGGGDTGGGEGNSLAVAEESQDVSSSMAHMRERSASFTTGA